MGLKEDLKLRPIASDKWAEIADQMAIHLYGKPPTSIFKTRRPLESTNEYALIYREENYEPITQQSFQSAVNAIIEAADHIHVDVENLDQDTANYLQDWTKQAVGKTYSHKDYIIRFVSKGVESDPNAVLVHMPVHPSQPFIPDYREDLPDFNNILNQNIDIDLVLVPSEDIQHLTDIELWYYGGEYIYKVEGTGNKKREFSAPYYWIITKEATRLAIPYETKKNYEYRVEDYYANKLDKVPFDVIGDNPMMDKIDGEVVEYHHVTYSGAVAIANEVVGIKSDSQIIDTRFTYPEKVVQYKACNYPGCDISQDKNSPYYGLYVVYDGEDCTTCPSCQGSGKIAPDTSPLGTHKMTKDEMFDADMKFIPPVMFIAPELGSAEYMGQNWRSLLSEMKKSLFLIDQNMTNQSGESKGYDVREKVRTITAAVKNVYSIYKNSLNAIQGFLRKPQDVELVLPPDFNIKTDEDIIQQLSESKNTSSAFTSELTKELLLKKYGNTEVTRRIVNFLEINDKLFGFTMDDIIKAKALYGNDLTVRDQLVHDKGLAVLKKLSMAEDFDTWTDERLKDEFEREIDDIMGLEPEREEIAEDPLLQLEAEAKSKLKGTVGGVQGIIQINAAVAAGQMTEEAAQALLQEIYGFSPEISDRLIEPVITVEPEDIIPQSPIA